MRRTGIVVAFLLVACGSAPARVDPSTDRAGGHLVLAWYQMPPDGEAVTDENMSIVDLTTGEVTDRNLSEWGAGDAQFKLEEIGDELVFRGSDGHDAGAFVVDADLTGEARLIGEAWYFVPSATTGRVWLALLAEPLPEHARPLRAVREVTLDGEVTVDDARPPSDNVVGALESGIVLQDDGLVVWDPVTETEVTRLDGVFPVDSHGDVLAWCDYECPEVHIDDIGAGTGTVATPDGPFRFSETYDGCFSPNGARLALEVELDDGGSRLGIVDVATGSTEVVKDIRLDHHFPLCAWSASGETVYFNSGEGRIASFETASGTHRIYEIPTDHVVMALVAID
jgi:hypothetical protein